MVATTGTTVIGAFDEFNPIADICQKHGIWLHVDVSNRDMSSTLSCTLLCSKVLISQVAVAEWLAHLPAKQEVCGSNPASYLC